MSLFSGCVCGADSVADDTTIDALPPQWETPVDFANRFPAEAKKYADSITALSSLREQREAVRQRVVRLRSMQAAITPFENKDAIQENLVTRDGDLEKELERMRMLLARVTGRVLSLPESSTAKTVGDVATARKRGVEEFLADPSVFPA